MNKPTLFALAALATLALTGCYGTYYGGARVYGGGPSYGGGYYASEPVFIQRDYVYISGRPYYVPVYRHHDRIYYTYGGRNHYFNNYECQKYRSYKHDRGYSHNTNYDNHRRQERYQYEQQRRQYEYQQRAQRDSSEHRKSSKKSQQELAKQQMENRRKQQEQYNAQWKAQHEYPRQGDKKKKKKNDD